MYSEYSHSVFRQWIFLNVFLVLLYQFIGHIRTKDRELLLNYLALFSLINMAWAWLEYWNYEPYHHILSFFYGFKLTKIEKYKALSGVYANSTISAAILALSSISLFRKKWWVLSAFTILTLYKFYSAMAVLTYCASVFSFIICRYFGGRARYFIGSFVLGVLWLFYRGLPEHGFFRESGRLEKWKMALSWIKVDENLLGKGLGFFYDNFHLYYKHTPIFRQAHNEYIEAWIAFGWVGIILLFILGYNLLKMSKDSIFFSVLVGIAVNAMGNFPLHISTIALLGIISYSYIIVNQGEGNGFQRNKNN